MLLFGLQIAETGGLYPLEQAQVKIVIAKPVVQLHSVQLETVPREKLQHIPVLDLIVLVILVHHTLALVFLVLAFLVHHLLALGLLEETVQHMATGVLAVLLEIDSAEVETIVLHLIKLETVKLGMPVMPIMLVTVITILVYAMQQMQLTVQMEIAMQEIAMQETVQVETVMQETVQ